MSDPRRFSDDEVEAVLRHALAAQRERGGLSRDELLEAARGVGLDAAAVDDAIAALDRGADDAALLRGWRVRRRRALVNHALAFTLVNALLYALDRATPPDDPWFFYPLILWGIALALDAFGYLRGPSPDALDALRADARTGLRCVNDAPRADAPAEAEALSRAATPRSLTIDRDPPTRR
jgi:hypothetical protein